MSDEDLESIRKKGEEWGRLITQVENYGKRIARIESALIAVIGAVVAAWAKSKGLW